MRIVQLILIGVLAISSMAIAVGVFVVGGTLIKQGDEVSEQNDLLADIHPSCRFKPRMQRCCR